MLDIADQTKANKVDVKSTREPNTLIETDNETPLPGSNINAAHAKSVKKITTISRASQDVNHISPIFGTSEFTASLPTNPPNFGLKFLFENNCNESLIHKLKCHWKAILFSFEFCR